MVKYGVLLDNDDKARIEYSDRNLSGCHFVHHKLKCTGLGLREVLNRERPGADPLLHGTAEVMC
jgi:hypothetical protein